jgi:hypothetical protein
MGDSVQQVCIGCFYDRAEQGDPLAVSLSLESGVPVAEEAETTKCRACGREFPKRFGQDFCDDCAPHVRGVPVAEEEN